MKSVGFLFLTTMAHAMHMLTIAREFALIGKGEAVIYVSNKEMENSIKSFFKDYTQAKYKIKFLKPPLIHRILRYFKQRHHPRARYVIKSNIKELFINDALVMTDERILEYKNHDHPLFIGVGHGAGDRACAFNELYRGFDYFFLSGLAKQNRMLSEELVSPETSRLIGYPKFDITFNTPTETHFNNDRPVVLYNPHFNKNETSWFKWGEMILNFFIENTQYNLLFAPHILLFGKKKKLNKKFYNHKNIIIDLESNKLCDMTYIKSADIYLGDVSSQVYEFIGFKPRPCIFLNANRASWQGNQDFRMWKMGDVVENMASFADHLQSAFDRHEVYQSQQQLLRSETFSITSESAGKRGATAIIDIIDGL